jgi:hypothetical protein
MKIIVDLENTLSNPKKRMYLKESGDKLGFKNAFYQDTLNQNVKDFMDSWFYNGYDVEILTCHDDDNRDEIVKWLDKYEVNYTKLIMMSSGINVDDCAFKETYVNHHSMDILFALDDDADNHKMFKKYRIPCLKVEHHA